MHGRAFYKMSGSGNDFVVVDTRTEPAGELANPDTIQAVCARGTGVGADGIVFLKTSDRADFGMVYLNSDGSKAALCGNASLCIASLAARLGIAGSGTDFEFETDAGVIRARVHQNGPEIDLQPPSGLEPTIAIELDPGEERIGFVTVGVPHLVVLVGDVEAVDVSRRGAELRRHSSVGVAGANVNFVARGPAGGPWALRTFERGVEGETLACGTGAVAPALLVGAWACSGQGTALRTRSGRELRVRISGSGDSITPSLGGEGRLVFIGEFGNL